MNTARGTRPDTPLPAQGFDFIEVPDMVGSEPVMPSISPMTEEATEEADTGEEPEDSGNHCIICGVDMGYCNPRQLCYKTYCIQELYSLASPKNDKNM